MLKGRWNGLHLFRFQKRLIKSPIDLSRTIIAKLLTEAWRVRIGYGKMAE